MEEAKQQQLRNKQRNKQTNKNIISNKQMELQFGSEKMREQKN